MKVEGEKLVGRLLYHPGPGNSSKVVRRSKFWYVLKVDSGRFAT